MTFDSQALAWTSLGVAGPFALLITLCVARGWTHEIDRRLLAAARPTRMTGDDGKPTRLQTALVDLAALGGDTLRVLFLLGCMVVLVAVGNRHDAVRLLLIFVSARLILYLFKAVTRRARPDLFEHGVVTYTTSFPSGHTFMATTLFLSSAVITTAQAGDALQIATIGLALTISAAIGWTRMVLAIHWPTDVLVGWLAGIAWASAWVILG